VAFFTLSLVGTIVQAQTTSHKIPYRGHLDLNGVPQSGDFDFRLDIQREDGTVLWSGQFLVVKVSAGAFLVTLGEGTAENPLLGDNIWQNEENDGRYLAIGVRVSGEADYVPLSGRQRILAVPYAARAETAKNYHVTGTLAVDGAASFNGGATVNGQLNAGNTTLGATIINGATTINGPTEINGTLWMHPDDLLQNRVVFHMCNGGGCTARAWCPSDMTVHSGIRWGGCDAGGGHICAALGVNGFCSPGDTNCQNEAPPQTGSGTFAAVLIRCIRNSPPKKKI
jgi:hypothetical protein